MVPPININLRFHLLPTITALASPWRLHCFLCILTQSYSTPVSSVQCLRLEAAANLRARHVSCASLTSLYSIISFPSKDEIDLWNESEKHGLTHCGMTLSTPIGLLFFFNHQAPPRHLRRRRMIDVMLTWTCPMHSSRRDNRYICFQWLGPF